MKPRFFTVAMLAMHSDSNFKPPDKEPKTISIHKVGGENIPLISLTSSGAFAMTEDEVRAYALKDLLKTHPKEEGWFGHHVLVNEVSSEAIKRIARDVL
jgi:hypothetical protein